MQNAEIARKLRQTADLMEVAGEDGFRIRSYRKAADVVDTCPEPVASLAADPKRLLALPGIGKTMCEHICALVATGELSLLSQLLHRFRPEMLDLLQVSGLGPKTVALIWQTYGAGTLDEVEALATAGKLRQLPRLGAKAEEKILRGIAVYRELSGRFRRDQAAEVIALLEPWLCAAVPGVSLTFCGSWRRGKETVGDLDIVACAPGFPAAGTALVDRFLHAPRLAAVLAEGESKCSIRLQDGLQVDLRLVPPESLGAALQYFTGSQSHNVSLRARAQQRGCKLNEYGVFRNSDETMLAGASEPGVYAALGLEWIPPELREDAGEIAAAESASLPKLIETSDIRGDLHMHTVASDGKATIQEMAAAAAARGYQYIAVTDHSQALAMANGLDEKRMLEHLSRIRGVEADFQVAHPGFRILAGVEVDILSDGRLDLDDAVLAQLDIVIGSIHSRFDQSREETTARLLRAVANPNLDVLGHPSGRLLLRREAYAYDFEKVLQASAAAGVAMEINASPERLDLNDVQARQCKLQGVPMLIDTDAHHPRHLANIGFGLAVARRAWLESGDVLNTLPITTLLGRLRRPR
ncbi:MAG TPA: DNA polymerase/3'-5' exonuclease PolX [Terriglobales bacterium]|nr:DNA polymerase/3'-5' exonuclease PolX [Terriglobales bacterium]